MRRHADAIAENRTTGEHARRIDGEHAHRVTETTRMAHQAVDERALAGSGRTGDADDTRAAAIGVEPANQATARFTLGLDQRDGASERARVAAHDHSSVPLDLERVVRPLAAAAGSPDAGSRSSLRRRW